MTSMVNIGPVFTNSSHFPYLKPSLSIADQLEQLQARGLIIDDTAEVLSLLSHINYYRLEAYWYTFYEKNRPDHFFVSGTRFDKVWSQYCFDRRLRAHISHALERIEVSFRTQFAYHLSQKFGPFPLNLGTLDFTSIQWDTESANLCKTCKSSNELFAIHFYSKYSDDLLPIWALVEILSFGSIVFYYKRIKSIPLKKQISIVYGLDPKELSSWLQHLYYIRNTCAHHSRLWNKRLTVLPSPPQRTINQEINSRWIFPPCERHENDPYNERRLFNTILIVDYFLLQICPKNTWKKEISDLIRNYSIDAIRMGFPENWEMDSFWQ